MSIHPIKEKGFHVITKYCSFLLLFSGGGWGSEGEKEELAIKY
jgi:hypothetical protein